jgi:hypothetical protein
MVFRVTNSNLLPTITQANLTTAIKNALAATNFPTLFDEVSGDPHLVIYEITLNNTATFGKAYLEIEITNDLKVRQRLHTNWDPIANTGANSGPWGPQIQFNNSTEITFRGFEKSDECRLVGIRQSNQIQFLGYLYPANKPAWWSENSSLYCFIPGSNNFVTWHGAAASNSPYGNATYTSSLGRAQMASSNPITSKRDVVTGILLYSNSNQGVCGRTSDELVMVSGSGLGIYDIIQVTPNVEEYTLLVPAAGGLALRTA